MEAPYQTQWLIARPPTSCKLKGRVLSIECGGERIARYEIDQRQYQEVPKPQGAGQFRFNKTEQWKSKITIVRVLDFFKAWCLFLILTGSGGYLLEVVFAE